MLQNIADYRDPSFIDSLANYVELINGELDGIKFLTLEDFEKIFAELDSVAQGNPCVLPELEGIATMLDPTCGYVLPNHMVDFKKLLQQRITDFTQGLHSNELRMQRLQEQRNGEALTATACAEFAARIVQTQKSRLNSTDDQTQKDDLTQFDDIFVAMDPEIHREFLSMARLTFGNINLTYSDKQILRIFVRAYALLIKFSIKDGEFNSDQENIANKRSEFWQIAPDHLPFMYPEINSHTALHQAMSDFYHLTRVILLPFDIEIDQWLNLDLATAELARQMFDSYGALDLKNMVDAFECKAIDILKLPTEAYTYLAANYVDIIALCQSGNLPMAQLFAMPREHVALLLQDPSYLTRLNIICNYYHFSSEQFIQLPLPAKTKLLNRPYLAKHIFDDDAKQSAQKLASGLSDRNCQVYLFSTAMQEVTLDIAKMIDRIHRDKYLHFIDAMFAQRSQVMQKLKGAGINFYQSSVITVALYELVARFAKRYKNRFTYSHRKANKHQVYYKPNEIDVSFTPAVAECIHLALNKLQAHMYVVIHDTKSTVKYDCFKDIYELLADIDGDWGNAQAVNKNAIIHNSYLLSKIELLNIRLKQVANNLRPSNAALKHLHLLRNIFDSRIGDSFLNPSNKQWLNFAAKWRETLDACPHDVYASLMPAEVLLEESTQNQQAATFNRFFHAVGCIRNELIQNEYENSISLVDLAAERELFKNIAANSVDDTHVSSTDLYYIDYGCTMLSPYVYACELGNCETVEIIKRHARRATAGVLSRFLHAHGFTEINATDDNGDTPLLKAIKQGEHVVAHALIVRDCDLSLTDSDKQTPMQLAASNGLDQIIYAIAAHTNYTQKQMLIASLSNKTSNALA
jgi:hypothetical protein